MFSQTADSTSRQRLCGAIRERLVSCAHDFVSFSSVPDAPLGVAPANAWHCCVLRWYQALKLLHSMQLMNAVISHVERLDAARTMMMQSHIATTLQPLLDVLQRLPHGHSARTQYLDKLKTSLQIERDNF